MSAIFQLLLQIPKYKHRRYRESEELRSLLSTELLKRDQANSFLTVQSSIFMFVCAKKNEKQLLKKLRRIRTLFKNKVKSKLKRQTI